MSNNRMGKYLKYALGEILLVVIGILIALQINNWNEERKQKTVVRNYLDQLLIDLEEDKVYYENVLSIIERKRQNYNTYRTAFDTPNLDFSIISEKILQTEFGTLPIEFVTTTIKSLTNSGDIKMFDQELRKKLMLYDGRKSYVQNVAKKNNYDAIDFQKSAAKMVTPDLLSRLRNQPELLEILDIRSQYAKIFTQVDAYFLWRQEGEDATAEYLSELTELADELKSVIKSELQQL